MTEPMLVLPPFWRWARAWMTMKNTSMGARAFRAFTNRVPKMPMTVNWGRATPRMIPRSMPTMMRLMRLIWVHFFSSRCV